MVIEHYKAQGKKNSTAEKRKQRQTIQFEENRTTVLCLRNEMITRERIRLWFRMGARSGKLA